MINGKVSKQLGIKNRLTVPYDLLPDIGTREIGEWKVQTILLPGHTLGSVSYIINDKYLFTGDSIAIVDGKAVTFNDFFNMDSRQQEENIPRISLLDNIELILTAHYGMSNNYDALFSGWN